MPTVIMLDVSASILRPSDPNDPSTTRQDIAQRGVLHLLQWMEKWQENEPVSLMTFSSSCRVLRPFGTNHAELRRALFEIEAEDSSRAGHAVNAASLYLQDYCGQEAPGCQIVLVADGDCSFEDVPELEAAAVALPPSTTVHIVAMGSEAELGRCETFKALADRSRGMFAGVSMPQKDASAHKRAFSMIARRYYMPYRGQLVFGNLSCKLSLHPDPNLGLDNEIRGEEGDQGGAGAPRPGLMPSVIAVRGFVANSLFGRWPETVKGETAREGYVLHQTAVQSRHAVFPDTRTGDPQSEGVGDAPPPPGFPSLYQNNTPHLCYSLMKAMEEEGIVAVCHLKSPAGASAQGRGTETAYLVVTICQAPGSASPYQLILVVPRTGEETGICPMHLLTESQIEDIPLLNLLSYFPDKLSPAPETLPSPETLSVDLTRFGKILQGLPAKKAAAYAECEKLRRSSLLYLMPCIQEAASKLLTNMMADITGTSRDQTLSAFYISDMLKQLQRTSEASQPIVRPKTPPPTGRRGRDAKDAKEAKSKERSRSPEGGKRFSGSINDLLS